MTALHWDASEVEQLENDLLEAALKAHVESPDTVRREAVRFRNEWRDLARESAGAHGKHYPSSITHEQVGEAATFEIGPDSALPQGGMGRGFEWGSVNQPPHNDMGQAIVKVPDRLESAVADMAKRLL